MKYISVIGDSISTYEGYIPEGYNLYYGSELQAVNEMKSVNDTWWMKVINALGGTLCVNNSFSGSRASGDEFPAACCDERINALGRGGSDPDAVLIYIGYNDFGGCVDIFPDGDSQSTLYFSNAYETMIKKIKARYPKTEIICGTLMPNFVRSHENDAFPTNDVGTDIEEYNRVIRYICAEYALTLADLGERGVRCETLDGLHPTANGHETMATEWIKSINK